MSAQWKPGDVARLELTNGVVHLAAIRLPLHEGGWASGNSKYIHSVHIASARPLVVIDPENRQQVERLAEAIPDCGDPTNHCDPQQCLSLSCWIDRVQTALREFANPTPPKPDEPMGLGAVVTTERDGDYILVSLENDTPWYNVQSDSFTAWSAVRAVRVLSEGVTS